ncbi:MAG TPA: SDR family NAD(P)-dependent oxidoreductase [bacterium]|nr:SDR family NAD(P)-dependent oxidoreductase [bacterium]
MQTVKTEAVAEQPRVLRDSVALVTGGASGIGKALSLAFAAHGARVAVADVNGPGAEAVAADLRSAGGEGLPVVMDVTSRGSVAAGIGAVRAAWDRIDIVANVAGWDRIIPFVETTEEFWDRVIAINFRGVLAACHAVLPHMIERRSGVIVNVSSEAGRAGSSGEAVYSGAKGAVIAFTKALAREVARYGIRVNCVAPGLTDTPLLQRMIADGNERLIQAIVRATPLQRLATPEEVAEAVVFLASERASFITGQTLSVGGGLTMT